MSHSERSVLVIAPDTELSGAIGSALSRLPGVKIRTESTTLTALNGHAADIASGFDVVLFQSAPGDEAEISAVRTLSSARKKGSVLMAVADGSTTLTDLRALTEAGVDEVLPRADLAGDIGAQVIKLRRPPSLSRDGGDGKIVAVMPARGGIGATTFSVNLADRLANEERRFRKAVQHTVALLDLDLQFGSAGAMLDLGDKDTLAQLATDGAIPDATFLKQSLQRASNGVSVLSAPGRFVPLDSLRHDQIAALVEAARAEHDFVVVDLPHALVGWIEPVLTRADRLILVTDLAVPSIRQCRRLIDFVTSENPTLTVDMAVARDRKSAFRSTAWREAEKALDRPFVHWIPNDPRTARAAADRGVPARAISRSASITRGVDAIARSLRDALGASSKLSA